MTEPKHTPGPWAATYDSQLRAAIEIYNTEDRILVAVLPDRGTVEAMPEIEANANLIADAWQLPDLRRENAELKVLNKDMYEALDHLRIAAQKVCDDFCCGAGCSQDARDCKLEGGLIRAEMALHKARGEAK